jgi:hypothetical protein
MTLRKEHRLMVFENRVLKRICGPKRDEVTGGWRKLHNEELHNLYSSPSIIRMIKNSCSILVVKPEGKRPQDVGGWTILKWILERQDGMVWTGSIWLRIGTSGRLL